MKEELLEYVFAHVHEDCLSDLRIPFVLNRYLDFILNIPEEMFDLNDWDHFLEYLCGIKGEIGTIKEAKEFLTNWVKEK